MSLDLTVTNVTSCDQCDQLWPMWPAVTNIENMTNLTKFILMLPGGRIGHTCPDRWDVIFWPVLKEAHKPTHSYCLSLELCQKNTNHKVTMGPWACGPLGLIAMSPNPISAAGAIRSQPCLPYVTLFTLYFLTLWELRPARKRDSPRTSWSEPATNKFERPTADVRVGVPTAPPAYLL